MTTEDFLRGYAGAGRDGAQVTRFALTLEFDGGPFMGLQRQDHGPSVQQAIEQAVARGHRRDGDDAFAPGAPTAGVHALAMRSHVDIAKAITPFRLMEALNAHLRPDPDRGARLRGRCPTTGTRASRCIGRRYLYRIVNRRAPLTLERGHAWHVARPLDAEAMHARGASAGRAARLHHLPLGRIARRQPGQDARPARRPARRATRVIIEAAARSFLHHQVRSMVGTLALVGLGQWREEQVAEALAAQDRAALGLNAPAEGLYFVRAAVSGRIAGSGSADRRRDRACARSAGTLRPLRSSRTLIGTPLMSPVRVAPSPWICRLGLAVAERDVAEVLHVLRLHRPVRDSAPESADGRGAGASLSACDHEIVPDLRRQRRRRGRRAAACCRRCRPTRRPPGRRR